jgi:1-acyl-sn-glycerol-3-phosphate acyltransferase
MLDTVTPFDVLADPAFVLKKQLMNVPVYGWFAARAGMIPVDREAHAKALKQLVNDARTRLEQGRQIVIFPEGTRGPPGVAGAYKPGVAALYRELGMACTPLALNTGVHWPAHGFLRTPGTIVFEFLEPIPAGLKRGEFMRILQDRIETASTALIAEGL